MLVEFPKLFKQYGDGHKQLSANDFGVELLSRLKRFEGCQDTDDLLRDVWQTFKNFLREYNIQSKDLPPIYITYTNGQVGGI